MEIILIASVGSDLAIGRGGDLAFHISADLKRFKSLTTGHTVIMGRKTFDSLPKGALPRRRNIVISRNAALAPELEAKGAEYAPSLEAALDMAREAGESEAFIIGGAQIYAQAIPLADRLELTHIDALTPDADAHFPAIPADFRLDATAGQEATADPNAALATPSTGDGFVADVSTNLRYRFATYRRK